MNKEKLCAIAEAYMKGIGFEKQPYLIYQRQDAGHLHIHIVSTNIQRDGSKIEMNWIFHTILSHLFHAINLKQHGKLLNCSLD